MKTEIKTIPQERVEELEKSLKLVEKKSQPFLKIEDRPQYEKANEVLSQLKAKAKEFDDERKTVTEPMNAALDAVNGIYMPKIKRCKELTTLVSDAMSAFLREEDRVRKIAEAKEQEKFLNKQSKLAEQGKPTSLELMPSIAPIATTAETKSGKSFAKKVWSFKIVSADEIPQKYLQQVLKLAIEQGLLNRVIRDAVDGGVRDIKGVEIFEDFQINTRLKG